MKLITAHSIALGIFLALVAVEAAPAQTLSARAAVDANSVFVGESVRFQIQVSGSETPTRPDLAAITDFTVNFNRGIVNSSSSITIINGRRTENRRKGYIFDYTLVPKREGRLSIPPITVSADGQSMKTQALSILSYQIATKKKHLLSANLRWLCSLFCLHRWKLLSPRFYP